MLPNQKVPETGVYSAGWHPWFITNYSLSEIEMVVKATAQSPRVIAIGECGLDRAIKTPIELQLKVFNLHLALASEVQKPVIVHAVRSYSDMLQALKKRQFKQALIFHDFRGNAQQMNQLLKFNSYFSFGEALLKDPKVMEKMIVVPPNRLFLETDESKLSIEKIYLSAASVLSTSMEELSRQIVDNFRTIFGDGLVKQD